MSDLEDEHRESVMSQYLKGFEEYLGERELQLMRYAFDAGWIYREKYDASVLPETTTEKVN